MTHAGEKFPSQRTYPSAEVAEADAGKQLRIMGDWAAAIEYLGAFPEDQQP